MTNPRKWVSETSTKAGVHSSLVRYLLRAFVKLVRKRASESEAPYDEFWIGQVFNEIVKELELEK